MKGYTKPIEFKTGICFICGEKCHENHYAHFDCAEAYQEEKARRIEQAKQEAK